MNGRSVFVAFALALLTACATSDQFVSKGSITCQEIDVPACSNNPADPVVRVQYRRGRDDFLFVPPSVCADAGKTIEFNLEGMPQRLPGSVAILPKNGKDTWLVGSNADDMDKIRILVPDWVGDGEHDYNLIASNGSCADPRVEVKRH